MPCLVGFTVMANFNAPAAFLARQNILLCAPS
jgi:hypothetical protein